jgi:tetratricopeptide (TPR) repeat protein
MRCAWTQGLPADLGEAIEALNESMVFYDADRYPVQHASLLMARGFAHASCALNVDRISNCDAAIADYSAAMTIRQEQDLHDSEPYAQLEIAEALGIKSDVADRESNCRRGLELLNQLKTQLPRNDLASALRRDELSAVFMVRLSETNPKVADCHEAIDLLQQCFRRTTDNAVKARLQLNLAYAHWVLAQTEEAGKNVRDALKALELASQIGGEAVNDITRGITHFNRGQTYLVAAAKEPRGQGGPNLEQALLAFEKATEVFTRDERPVLYAWLAERMGYLFMLRCKESGDNADQVKAMELLGDAAAVAEGTGAPLIAERAREHLEEMTETAA